MQDFIFRYELEYSNSDGDETSVVLQKHKVIKETEHSYFIKKTKYPVLDNKLKRVPKCKIGTGSYKNRFAYASRDDALKHFINRTQKRINWYEYWTDECKKAIEIAKEM